MKRAKQRDPRAWMKHPEFVMFLHTDRSDWYEQMRSVTEKYADRPVLMKGHLFQTESVRIVESPPDIDAMAAAIEAINLRNVAAQRMATWLANQVACYGHGALSLAVDQEARITLDELSMPDMFIGRATRA